MVSPFAEDLDSLSLDELGEANEYLKTQIDAESKAARGKGGVGANKFDKKANELADQQFEVENEIFDRLLDIHQSRSERAQSLDLEFSATRTNDPEQWANAPSRFDYPGLDTPKR